MPLLLLCSAVFALIAGRETQAMRDSEAGFKELSIKVDKPFTTSALTLPPAASANEKPWETEPAAEPEPEILPQYAELAQQNPDMFGWIKIDGTPVDYPVMHTPDDPEKYLRRGFDGEYSMAGTIFLDCRCSPDSDNLIVYGHNMKNNTMFGSILNYKDQSYWELHPVIHFDTLHEKQDYEVLAAFYDRVYTPKDTCFKYYNFIDAADGYAFDDAIRSYREKALYDTGVSAQYGDTLLTLSTCAYHVENGRFVIVARKIE